MVDGINGVLQQFVINFCRIRIFVIQIQLADIDPVHGDAILQILL